MLNLVGYLVHKTDCDQKNQNEKPSKTVATKSKFLFTSIASQNTDLESKTWAMVLKNDFEEKWTDFTNFTSRWSLNQRHSKNPTKHIVWE